jgi:subtilisin family serine protease
MSKAVRYLVSAIAILTLTMGSVAMVPAGGSGASIYLKRGVFVPAQLQAAQESRKYFIVQFAGPVKQSWKDEVSAAGGEILDYIPDFAFKVRMNPAIVNRVGQLGFVSAIIPFQAQFKYGTDLKRDGEMSLYLIRIEKGSDYGLVRSLVARTGAQVLSADEDLMVVAANGSFVEAIAAVEDVASINNYHLNQTFSTSSAPLRNDTARDIIGATVANNRGYDGSSQIVAVADTGLGGGTAATAHSGIPSGRIVNIFNLPGAAGGCFKTVVNDGAVDVDSGHGTHTASSVLNGGGANGIGKGVAPAARLVFQATENWATVTNFCQSVGGYPANGYFLIGLPSDLKTMYQQAYNAGARIHSNSWGAAVAGDYTVDSVNTDSFVWTNRDMVITFSAGNEGVDANADGVVDNDSTGAPGTSKNVITVGASENARTDNYPCDLSLTYTSSDIYQTGQTCASMGGSNLLGTAGSRWGFTANPLKDDVTAGNAQQMAPFSSRGPTDDGRIKPDVVAPGTWILSGASSLYQEGYGDPVNPQTGAYQWDGWGMPYNSDYKYMGGTSMSNPLAAGGATVVKDYYSKAYGVNASAALVKATLINSAVDLLDENNDGANDNDFPIPNMHEGWGLINLDAATDGSIKYVEEGIGVSTGGSQSFTVTPTGGPLKVTLVWSDYPSTDTASINLVNDLDLTVSNSGNTYRGNVFSGGWSATGGSADRRNNVENVYVQSPAAGTYTINISGFNVPNGPQKFALVVDGGTVSAPPPPTAAHIGDLDGANQTVNNKNWRALVTVTVHNDSHTVVANATVSGNWSGGLTGTGSCVTNASGVCTITSANISTRNTSATFTVSNVSASGYTYQASSNHDPESDSNGTAITITKP